MSLPEWVDKQWSADLPQLRARGESQELEFKVAFPENASDLAKDIAAFATSNTGTIVLGVSDNGDLMGLSGTDDQKARDQLLGRIRGICRNTVKPAITPSVKWAMEDGRYVLVLIVPRGTQAIYYSNHIPYVRHITEARPAEPHEVVERVREWMSIPRIADDSTSLEHAFLGQLAPVLNVILIYADEAEERSTTPWLEMWRAEFDNASDELRRLAAEDVAIKGGYAGNLNDLAAAVDTVAHFRLHLGCGPELEKLVEGVRRKASEIKRSLIDPVQISEKSVAQARDTILKRSRQLQHLASRANQLVEEGRIEEVQSEASEIGYPLLQFSHFNLDALAKGLAQRLRPIARDLHLCETTEIYMDGGASMRAIIERVQQRSRELEDLAALIGQELRLASSRCSPT